MNLRKIGFFLFFAILGAICLRQDVINREPQGRYADLENTNENKNRLLLAFLMSLTNAEDSETPILTSFFEDKPYKIESILKSTTLLHGMGLGRLEASALADTLASQYSIKELDSIVNTFELLVILPKELNGFFSSPYEVAIGLSKDEAFKIALYLHENHDLECPKRFFAAVAFYKKIKLSSSGLLKKDAALMEANRAAIKFALDISQIPSDLELYVSTIYKHYYVSDVNQRFTLTSAIDAAEKEVQASRLKMAKQSIGLRASVFK